MGGAAADVRLVFHLNLPKSVEGFFQESGRAGRDGLPSKSVCCFSHEDSDRMTWILGASPLPSCLQLTPPPSAVVYQVQPRFAFRAAVLSNDDAAGLLSSHVMDLVTCLVNLGTSREYGIQLRIMR